MHKYLSIYNIKYIYEAYLQTKNRKEEQRESEAVVLGGDGIMDMDL